MNLNAQILTMLPFLLGFLLVGLALPRAIVERSLSRFLHGLVITFFGVMVPMAVFLLSAFLSPDWKGDCRLGWLECFHLGKLALLPLVLWATAALYKLEVLTDIGRSTAWVVLGLWTGCAVAGGCFAFGVVSMSLRQNNGPFILFLAVPLYVAIWHGVRAFQLGRKAPVSTLACSLTFLGSLPFWFLSLSWSRRLYEGLPDQSPGCFVVTAAARGHVSLVGPLVEVGRNDRMLQANRQLLTFWQFEALWAARAPRSHRAFRRLYNFIGPRIARRISSAWRASLAYICLKPAELFAASVLYIAAVNERRRDATGERP